MPAELHAIVAQSENGVIGVGNKLPWSLPADMRRFKLTTWGYPCIMGRKTFESIGKPLPGRQNIVMSRSGSLVVPDGVQVATDVAQALSLVDGAEKAYVIGGAEIYQLFAEHITQIELTTVMTTVTGHDLVTMPYLDGPWENVSSSQYLPDAKNTYMMTFTTLRRVT